MPVKNRVHVINNNVKKCLLILHTHVIIVRLNITFLLYNSQRSEIGHLGWCADWTLRTLTWVEYHLMFVSGTRKLLFFFRTKLFVKPDHLKVSVIYQTSKCQVFTRVCRRLNWRRHSFLQRYFLSSFHWHSASSFVQFIGSAWKQLLLSYWQTARHDTWGLWGLEDKILRPTLLFRIHPDSLVLLMIMCDCVRAVLEPQMLRSRVRIPLGYGLSPHIFVL